MLSSLSARIRTAVDAATLRRSSRSTLFSIAMAAVPTILVAQTSPVAGWFSSLWSIILLALGFSLVIFVHELGHFLAAKWAKVRVEKFCIGFGKELFGFTRGETRYGFNLLPLGGYVKMLGQEDFVVDKSGELKVKGDPNSFTNKPIGMRMIIVSGGVLMNLLFAAIAFAVVVMIGRLQPPPIVGIVVETSPAGRAGLQTGDRILEINGRSIRSWEEMTAAIMLSDPGEVLKLKIERNGRVVEPSPCVLPEFNKADQVRKIGIGQAMNLRVAQADLAMADNPQPNELQKYDKLFGLVENGQVRQTANIGDFVEAVSAARGAPVELVVERPVKPQDLSDLLIIETNPDVESTKVHVRVKAGWRPMPYARTDEDTTGSLLGLVPRLTAAPYPDKTFEKAGVQSGDVIARIGSYAYPTYAELRLAIEEGADQPLTLEVRRPRAENQGLSAKTVEFCTRHREELIAVALVNAGQVSNKLAEWAKTDGLSAKELADLAEKLKSAQDGPAWRRWLENVDLHKVAPLRPKRPFALFSKVPPTIDAVLVCVDEDHLVVADVVEKYGERLTPARAAGIPRGAVITGVDGQPVGTWRDLSEIFRQKAGREVELAYRVADDLRRTKLKVPMCITAALNLPFGSRIISIDGKAIYSADRGGKREDISLPDWRAVEGLLQEAVGRTVSVAVETYRGERRQVSYAVTAENADPWLARVFYAPPFANYPLLEKRPVSNPITAAGIGFRQAYDATVQTVQSIRHMIFTRQVGLSKVSGPVGIVRMGSNVADRGVINLLWFLAIISANLAVINFLPLPIVDGGLFLFLLMEKIRGEPVSIKTQIATQLVGIALIATVFILITYQDIKNWIFGT